MSTQGRRTLKDEIDHIERHELDKDHEYVRAASTRDLGQVYSIRIPVSQLETLRRMAAERGVRPSAMLRDWILDRLDLEQVFPASERSSRRNILEGQARTILERQARISREDLLRHIFVAADFHSDFGEGESVIIEGGGEAIQKAIQKLRERVRHPSDILARA